MQNKNGASKDLYRIEDNYLVVSTHLKNIRQIGSFPQIGVKIKIFETTTQTKWSFSGIHFIEPVCRIIFLDPFVEKINSIEIFLIPCNFVTILQNTYPP